MNKIEKVSVTKDQMLLIKSTNFNTKCRKIINEGNLTTRLNQ